MSDVENEAVVARRASKLSALLAASDETGRAVRFPGGRVRGAQLEHRVRRWSVAAAVVAVVAIATGVAPVRAWMVARVSSVWSAITGASAPAPSLVAPGTTASSSVSFVPAPGAFTIDVARRQAGGNLRIENMADSVASAEARGGSGDWLVLPDGVRLLNDSAATHDYVVRVPAGEFVSVRIGGGRPVSCQMTSVTPRCSYPLRPLGR